MIRTMTLLASVAALSACVGESGPTERTLSAPQATGVASLVGRPLTQIDGQGSVLLNADGTANGTRLGAPLFLSWTQEGEQFCFSGTEGNTALQFECQTVQITGNTVTFLRSDGTAANRYRIG